MNKQTAGQTRAADLDLLRVLASMAVVVIHVSAQNWYGQDVYGWTWNVFNGYDSLVRWAVPVFVMISGALFLQREIPIRTIYTKYIVRIVAAFCVWNLVYVWYLWHRGKLSTGPELVTQAIRGNYHMWYLVMIIGVYMAMPLLRLVVQNETVLRYYLVMALLACIVVPTGIEIVQNLPVDQDGTPAAALQALLRDWKLLDKSMFRGFSVYFVLGWWFHRRKRPAPAWLAVGVFLAGWLLTLGLSVGFARMKGEPYGFYGEQTIPILLESVGIFLLVDRCPLARLREARWLGTLSRCTFGIYLVHPLVMNLLGDWFGLTTLRFGPVLSVPVVCLLTWSISAVLALALHRIPVVRDYIV